MNTSLSINIFYNPGSYLYITDDSEMLARGTHGSYYVPQSRQHHNGAEFHRQQQRERRDVHLGSSRREVSRGGETQ